MALPLPPCRRLVLAMFTPHRTMKKSRERNCLEETSSTKLLVPHPQLALNPQGAQAQECTLVHDPLALWDQVHTLKDVVPTPTTIRQPLHKDPQTGYSKIVPQSRQKYRLDYMKRIVNLASALEEAQAGKKMAPPFQTPLKGRHTRV
ncbi:hypothetical protein Tco_0071941 [Tanacetum coccineum]